MKAIDTMNKTGIILLLLAALPLCAQVDSSATVLRPLGGEEAQNREMQVQRALNKLATGNKAVSFGTSTLPPEVRSRLHDILMIPDRRRVVQAIEAWLEELLKREPDAAVSADEVVLLRCLCEVVGADKERVHEHIARRVRHTFSGKEPVDNRNLQNFLNQVLRWEASTLPGSMAIVDAVNGAPPRSILLFSHNDRDFPYLAKTNMLWSNPRTYAPYLLSLNDLHTASLVAVLLHDADGLERAARLKGVQHWRYPWGLDLPEGVAKALELMSARRRAELPDAAAAKGILQAAESAPAGMRGFTPRCILAADPTACAWKPLSDPKASLFEMPDTTAVHLAQWDNALLGPKTKLSEDFAALEKQLEALAKEKRLSALLVFSLVEDDLSLPGSSHRPWMDVDGYDSCRAVMAFDITAEGVDVLVDEKGPHFSRNDPKLRTAYRSLNLALHRCVLRMALLERDGKSAVLDKAADRLAACLNKYKAWPLLWNQYSLRGVSPHAYLRLIRGFKGRRSLLTAFTHVAAAPDVEGNLVLMGERPTPQKVADMLTDRWICDGVLEATPQERDTAVKHALEMESAHPDKNVSGTLTWFMHRTVPDALGDATADNAEVYRRYNGFRGLCSVCRLVDKGDIPAARRMLATMAPEGSDAYSSPATRLAAARIARAEGRNAEADRLEKDAVALTAYLVSLFDGRLNSRLAYFALLRYGLVQETERLQLLLPNKYADIHADLAEAYAARGMYGAAAYHMEALLHGAICQSAPTCNGSGSHRDVAKWRTAADLYRAAYLRKNGRAGQADRLEKAARQAQPKLAAAVDCSAPAVQEDCSLPQALASAESPFESPFYTWHLEGEDGKPATAEGRITYGNLSPDNTSSNWVQVFLKSGRYLVLPVAMLPAEDVANIKDWTQRNGIRQFHTTYGLHFYGKPLEMVQDKPFQDPGFRPHGVKITHGKRVLFQNMSGGRCHHYTEALKEPDRKMLEDSMQPVHGPNTKLRTFATLPEAEADAMLNERNVLCLLLGRHGSPADQAFRAMEQKSPDTVGEWNFAFSILPCYQDDHGNWEPEAQRVMDYAAPALDLLPAQGTPAWERELAQGIGLELPTFGLTGWLINTGSQISARTRFVFPGVDLPDTRVAEFYAAIKAKDAAKVERMLAETPALAKAPLRLEHTNPLFAALPTFNARIVDSLLEHGADPNSLNKNQMTVLHMYATYPPAHAVLETLLRHGANPNGPSMDHVNKTFTYPVCFFNKDPKDLEAIIDAGADISRRDGVGCGALIHMSWMPQFVDLLCQKYKADPNESAADGSRPLSSHNQMPLTPESVDKLLSYGADPYLPTVDAACIRLTPPVATNRAPGLASTARRRSPDNIPHFATLLCYAQDFRAMLNVMFKHNIDFSRKDADGNEILGHLIKRGCAAELSHLDELIAHGADIHATFNGKPLLYHLVDSSYATAPFNRDGKDPARKLAFAFETLVAHGLDPYQPFGGYDDVFDYAESDSTDEAGIRRPRTAQYFKPFLQDWEASHPRQK